MNSRQLQLAIDRTIATIQGTSPRYHEELYKDSVQHLKKLYAVQAQRAALVSKPLIKPGSFYETKL